MSSNTFPFHVRRLVPALLIFHGCAFAALTPEVWATRDPAACATALNGGGSPAERLLISTLKVDDAAAQVGIWRRLTLAEETWIRREALSALCEYFFIEEQADSLLRRSAQFAELTGTAFPHSLAPPPAASRWWVQVGAFSTESGAQAALKAAGKADVRSRVLREGGLYKAQLGAFHTRAEAGKAADAWRRAGRIKEHRIVEESSPDE